MGIESWRLDSEMNQITKKSGMSQGPTDECYSMLNLPLARQQFDFFKPFNSLSELSITAISVVLKPIICLLSFLGCVAGGTFYAAIGVKSYSWDGEIEKGKKLLDDSIDSFTDSAYMLSYAVFDSLCSLFSLLSRTIATVTNAVSDNKQIELLAK